MSFLQVARHSPVKYLALAFISPAKKNTHSHVQNQQNSCINSIPRKQGGGKTEPQP